MSKVVIAGLVSAKMLGDALQYCVTAKMVNDIISRSEITLVCMDVHELDFLSEILGTSPRFINGKFTGTSILKVKWNDSFIKTTPKLPQKNKPLSNGLVELPQFNDSAYFKELLKKLNKNDRFSYIFNKYVVSPFIKKTYSFDAGILGGHTITGTLHEYIIQYENFRLTVPKGPIVTSPISLSSLSIDYCRRTDTTVLKRLKQALEKLDFIFVRGPHSLRILQDELNFNDKMEIALDSGFGVGLIYPEEYLLPLCPKSQKIRVVIIPRRQYFQRYRRMGLYTAYLESIVGLIKWLNKNYCAEIFLATQISDNHLSRRYSGIDDLIELLEKRNPFTSHKSGNWQIFNPKSIIEAFNFYRSADIVVSSYMHGGIIALSSGVPCVFIAPLIDIKILDNLANLHLDPNDFLIDMFDPALLTTELFIEKIHKIIENLENYKKNIKISINRVMHTLYSPVKKLLILTE